MNRREFAGTVLTYGLLQMLWARDLFAADVKPVVGQWFSDLNALGNDLKGRKLYRPVGCDACKNSGYKGRKGIFELMEMNSVMREMVFRKEPVQKIKEQARLSGMVTLLEDGVRKIFDGLTALEEVALITHREDITVAATCRHEREKIRGRGRCRETPCN